MSLYAFLSPGPVELIIIAAIVLLLFGKRLPSVMGSLGKGIVEFKKGVRGIETEIDSASQAEDSGAKDSGAKESVAKEKEEEPAGK